MPPKIGIPADVVEIDSSDDEEDVSSSATRAKPPQSRPKVDASTNKTTPQSRPQVRQQQRQQSAAATTASVPTNEAMECRSFWKAGAYAASPTTRVAPGQGVIPL